MVLCPYDVEDGKRTGPLASPLSCQLFSSRQIPDKRLTGNEKHCGELICPQLTVRVKVHSLTLPCTIRDTAFSNHVPIHQGMPVFVRCGKHLTKHPFVHVYADAYVIPLDEGELSVTLKKKRQVIRRRYRDEIECYEAAVPLTS